MTKWDFLWMLRQLLARGHSLALPAFTFAFCRGTAFTGPNHPSETGQLADWAMTLPEFRRTAHPIYSFAVAGPAAEAWRSAANSTTFGDDSIFAEFERQDARIVMVGADWRYCTYIHRLEEQAAVPYRIFKDFDGNADFGDGSRPVRARMFVRDMDIGAKNDFSPLVRAIREAPDARRAAVWGGAGIEAVDCATVRRLGGELLQADPLALVDEPARVQRALADRHAAAGRPSLQVAIAGSATMAPMAAALQTALSALVRDQRVEVSATPFGRALGELADPSGALARSRPALTILPDRLEDLMGIYDVADVDPNLAFERVDQYCAAIARFRSFNEGWLVVHRFVAIHGAPSDAADGTQSLLHAANDRLESGLSGIANLRLVDPAPLLAQSPAAFDPRLWFLGRFPYSAQFTERLAVWHAGMVLAATGRGARLVVVDLDNTLWGGVLGEDGVDALAIGGDYPGNAYVAFQRALKRLSASGIVLAVCSKNDEGPALAAMDARPEMVLRSADFVARRIDWQPKWRNVLAICEELSLGPASVLFIDDNPVERAQMRRHLPQVNVLDLPDDPALYASALAQSPWLSRLEVTGEDATRAEKYRARAEALKLRETLGDSAAFHATLEPRLHLARLSDANSARAAQLVQKTNQFNTTARRYGAEALRRMAADGIDVIVIGFSDRFSGFENIGLLVAGPDADEPQWLAVDLYLLSCRVLGRGIEDNVLRWLVRRAAALGYAGVIGRIVETERNTPVRGVFGDAGFVPGARPGEWRLPVAAGEVRIPEWLSIIDEFAESPK
jgi:FkbH-like protein